MLMLAAQPGALFVGQNVACDGSAMFHDFDGVPAEQRLEFPVAEELQLGFCAGLALQGFLPICVFPRMDFLMRAMDQLINHLDKLEKMSRCQFKPKVIIRTRVGPKVPLNAGPQHTQDHAAALRLMLTNTCVLKITETREIMLAYTTAIGSKRSSVVVECC